MAGPWPGRRQRPRIQGANLGPGQTRAGGGPGPGPVAVWGSGSFAGGGSGKPQGGQGLIRSGECSILTSHFRTRKEHTKRAYLIAIHVHVADSSFYNCTAQEMSTTTRQFFWLLV